MRKAGVFLGAASVAVALSIATTQAQQKQTKTKEAIYASADDAKFKDVVPGVSRAVLWGDDKKGPYGAYTKFVPKFDAGMHTHSNDIWLVVIKGAYLYKDDAGEKRVKPGEFIRIPAKAKHWSGGDAKDGALFYEESSGKFDLIPAK